MGDTGSLALGGFASCIGVFTGNALYIAVVGIMFVLSSITVIIQVIYYKATGGKRVFLMAPVHHHFQEKGYSECKIAYAYAAVTAVLGAVCVLVPVSYTHLAHLPVRVRRQPRQVKAFANGRNGGEKGGFFRAHGR